MSPADDYRDDMIISRLSDTDIENLLSGDTPQGSELIALAHFVDALRSDHDDALDARTVERYAAEAATIVRSNRPTRDPSGARSVVPKPGRNILRLRTKTAAALASLLVVGSTSGVAAAANGSAPGDLLYGLDIALEKVGIGAGGAAERLEEARALAAGGNAADALAHAAAAIVELEDEDDEFGSSQDALMSAAESVRSSGDETSQEVREKVALLLEFLADNDERLNGREVAERAREIGGPPQDVPPVATPDAPGPGGGDSPDPDGGGGPPDSVPATPGPPVSPPVTTP